MTTAADGTWSLKLAPLAANATPQQFKVVGANTTTFANVVVGEVWFCSGQSNMEWSMNSVDNAIAEKEAANFPLIRFFKVPRTIKFVPQKDVAGAWVATAPESVGDKSAVAYFFGRRLHQALDVPVGLVQSAWGGTRIEPWTPACGFEELPALMAIKERVESADPTSARHQRLLSEYITSLQGWIKAAQTAQAARELATAAPAFPEALAFKSDKGAHQQPTVLYNGMMVGLVPYAIKGAIWYQGESNNGEGMLYLEKTKALVNGWRKVWGQGDFPWYAVQLAPYNYGEVRKEQLPAIWEAQALGASAIANTGYTVINDIGNTKDIHPRNKQDVGLRMANQALNRTYGMSEIRWQGPVYKEHKVEGGKLRVTFDHAEGLKTRDGKAPDWFEVLGSDGTFYMDGALTLPELKNSRKLYAIDLPTQGNFESTPPKYTVDNSATVGAFTRVAYLLQLKDDSGVRYVCTIMDAFTKEARLLGIPYKKSGIKHQLKVNNLTVRSNVPGILKLDSSDGGNIEFWDSNYGMANQLGLVGAAANKYDFDDQPSAQGSGSYGCMQVHSWKDKETLWAYNNFNGGSTCDVGIGNNKVGEHPDYTFMANGGHYEVRRLMVLVK